MKYGQKRWTGVFLVIQMANKPMKMLNSTNHLERTKQNKQKKIKPKT